MNGEIIGADRAGNISKTAERGHVILVNVSPSEKVFLQNFAALSFVVKKVSALPFFRYPPPGLSVLWFSAILLVSVLRCWNRVPECMEVT